MSHDQEIRSRPESGFSLLELLTSLGVVGITSTAVVGFLLTFSSYHRSVESKLESRQGLHTVLEALGREIRLAGACLPQMGDFVAFAGTAGVSTDSLTIRAGVLSANSGCIQTTLAAAADSASRTLTVGSTDGLSDGRLVYLQNATGAGEIVAIDQVVDASTITIDRDLSGSYLASSGLWAIEERVYSVDPSTYGEPALVVAIDDQAPMPFASGIEALDVHYRLDRNCPACDVVDLPADSEEWRLVTTVDVDLKVVATPSSPTQTASRTVQPRNLLF